MGGGGEGGDYFILYNDTIRILFLFFQMGCFVGPQNQQFRMKKGCVIFRPKSAKMGYFSNVGTGMVFALVC